MSVFRIPTVCPANYACCSDDVETVEPDEQETFDGIVAVVPGTWGRLGAALREWPPGPGTPGHRRAS
jgi:hypothetical protein